MNSLCRHVILRDCNHVVNYSNDLKYEAEVTTQE